MKTKKKLTFPGKQATKKKSERKVVSKEERRLPRDESSLQAEKTDEPEPQEAPDGAQGDRIVRKSTRTSVIVRQAERDAIRAALQATMKVSFNSHGHSHCQADWKILPIFFISFMPFVSLSSEFLRNSCGNHESSSLHCCSEEHHLPGSFLNLTQQPIMCAEKRAVWVILAASIQVVLDLSDET